MYIKLSENRNFELLHQRRVGQLSLNQVKYRAGNWEKPHRHENARFVFVLHGNFREKFERKERCCKPFTGIFRTPDEKHYGIYDKGVVCLSVDLAPSWLKRLENFSVKLVAPDDFHSQSLSYLITKIANEMTFDDDVSSLAIDSLLTEIAVDMYRNFSDANNDRHPRWLKTVVEYIQENSSANLSLNEIASVAQVHPVHLSRTFRNHYRQTVAEYIRRFRVESACDLLLSSNLTIAQIALDVGFADQSHFTKIFKRLTFETPAQFRKNKRMS